MPIIRYPRVSTSAKVYVIQNFSIMSEYVTQIGRIKHRKQTGLRAVNQRKIAKAIRRAVGMGLMPSVHKHPEVLEVEARLRNERLMGGRP